MRTLAFTFPGNVAKPISYNGAPVYTTVPGVFEEGSACNGDSHNIEPTIGQSATYTIPACRIQELSRGVDERKLNDITAGSPWYNRALPTETSARGHP